MNFRSYEIKDICKIKSGKRLPKGTDFSEKPTKHKYIRARDIKNGKIDGSDLGYISEETQKKIERYIVNTNDIIITIAGTIGEVALVSKKFDGVNLTENAVRLTEFSKDVCPEFLAYILKSPERKEYMEQVAGGSAQPKLGIYKIEAIKVDLPDVQIQHKIADILSAYDNLIENNQKQIKLLEEAAQRLYKEWFVDLRFPGHENTKIVDGVPEGWRVASIADICDTVGGGTPSTKIQSYYEKGDILWVTPTDITRNFSLALLDTEKKITPEGLKNSSANMLPAETILMTSRASVGFFGMCKYEVCTNQGFISCIPKRENLQMYLLFNLKSRVEEIRQKAGGSTYLEISKTVFRELKIILPKDEVLAEYQKNVHDIFDEIYCRTEMIKSLVDMRNRLLPKLMSGEVEV